MAAQAGTFCHLARQLRQAGFWWFSPKKTKTPRTLPLARPGILFWLLGASSSIRRRSPRCKRTSPMRVCQMAPVRGSMSANPRLTPVIIALASRSLQRRRRRLNQQTHQSRHQAAVQQGAVGPLLRSVLVPNLPGVAFNCPLVLLPRLLQQIPPLPLLRRPLRHRMRLWLRAVRHLFG